MTFRWVSTALNEFFQQTQDYSLTHSSLEGSPHVLSKEHPGGLWHTPSYTLTRTITQKSGTKRETNWQSPLPLAFFLAGLQPLLAATADVLLFQSKQNKISVPHTTAQKNVRKSGLAWGNTNRLSHSQAAPGREGMDARGNFKGKVMSVRKRKWWLLVSAERDPLPSSHLEMPIVTSGAASAHPHWWTLLIGL